MKQIIIKLILGVIGFILLGDIIFLNSQVIQSNKQVQEAPNIFPIPSRSPMLTNLSCPSDCLDLIKEATKAVKVNTSVPEKIVNSPCPCQNSPVQVKEYYIPLGSGSTNATSWTDIAGAEAYINPANYGQIKSVTFEALLRIPSGSGKVFARLYNVNDKVGIFESEISAEGNSGVRVESTKINLASGNKLYRVQLKTSIGAESYLDLARIKIIIN